MLYPFSPCFFIYFFFCISLPLQDKCSSGEYENIEQLREDVHLLVNNAKIYNEDGSQVYKDAESIWVMVLHRGRGWNCVQK